MSANYKKDVLPRLWYRHSGQPEIYEFPSSPTTTSIDERAITRDVGGHHITHLYIENGVIPCLVPIAPQLTHLMISGISATSQLHYLSSLSKLEELDLADNDFSNGLPAVVGQLTSLQRLYLGGCQLTDLPQSLSSLSQLKWLSLSHNELSDLPQSLSSLTQLKALFLSDNYLSDLPQRFSCETQLEFLYLSSNNFVRLPAIHRLSNLKVLSLQYNEKLQRLDEEVSQLQNLEMLDCYGCWLLQSPPYAVCLQGLKAVKKYFADLKVKKEPEGPGKVLQTRAELWIDEPETTLAEQKCSVLIQKRTDAELARAKAKIVELEARIDVLATRNVELENELSEHKLHTVTPQAREETDELKGITKNIDIPFQDTVQDTVVESKHTVDVDNKHPDVKSKTDNDARKEDVADSQLKVDEITQGEDRQATGKAAIDEGNVTKERQQYDVPSNLQQRDSADSSGDVSEQQDKILDYVFLPEDLGKKIEQLCQVHSVDDFQILQHPYIWQEVVVLAREAEAKLTTALKDLLADNPQYTEFIVEPFDYDGQSETELLHWQRTLNFDRKTTTTGSAVCELVVHTDSDSNKVYLVGPAHMMFCKEANEKFQTDKCDIKEVREDIETTLPLRSVAIRSDHKTEVEIQPTPMIAYRYRYKQRYLLPNHHKLYANDCILFQFDTGKAPQVQRELRSANLFRDEKLREVTTTDSLQAEHRRPLQIAVQGYRGHLYHTVNINRDIRECRGVHLTFVLTSKDKEGHYHILNNGDSGSIVYYIAEEKDGRKIHQPWGMLVQALSLPRFNERVYRAVVLNKVFRDIEEDYGLSAGEIQLYQLPNQGAAASNVNVMSQQGNRTGPVPSSSTTAQVHKTSTTLTIQRTTTQADLSNPSTTVSTEPVSSMPSISNSQQTPRVGPTNLCSQDTQQANDLELIPPNLGYPNIQQENDRELVHAGLDYSIPQQTTGSPEYSADDLSD